MPALRRDRRARSRPATAAADRGDEDLQRDRRAARRARSTAILVEDGQPVEYGQPLIVIESVAFDLLRAHVRENPDRQSRRDRAAHPARRKELGIATVAVHSTADADAMHVSWPTKASASARRRRANPISTSRRCSPPARSPAPTRSIPATAFCRRTPASPKSWPSTASPSSAPSPSISA